jgi:hypothetical protein
VEFPFDNYRGAGDSYVADCDIRFDGGPGLHFEFDHNAGAYADGWYRDRRRDRRFRKHLSIH